MSDRIERKTADFDALLGGWKYKEPEPKVLQEYANGSVKVLSRDRLGNNPAESVISTDFGTITVCRSTGLLSLTSPYFGIILKSDGINRFLSITKDSPKLDLYTIHENGDFVGNAFGPKLDLGLAVALGIEDETLQRDAEGSSVDSRVVTRIKTTFIFNSMQQG